MIYGIKTLSQKIIKIHMKLEILMPKVLSKQMVAPSLNTFRGEGCVIKYWSSTMISPLFTYAQKREKDYQ